jgi:hypothetical protein
MAQKIRFEELDLIFPGFYKEAKGLAENPPDTSVLIPLADIVYAQSLGMENRELTVGPYYGDSLLMRAMIDRISRVYDVGVSPRTNGEAARTMLIEMIAELAAAAEGLDAAIPEMSNVDPL